MQLLHNKTLCGRGDSMPPAAISPRRHNQQDNGSSKNKGKQVCSTHTSRDCSCGSCGASCGRCKRSTPSQCTVALCEVNHLAVPLPHHALQICTGLKTFGDVQYTKLFSKLFTHTWEVKAVSIQGGTLMHWATARRMHNVCEQQAHPGV